MPERYDLTDGLETRRPIDAGWSKRKKALVGGASVGLAAGALATAGVLLYNARPVGLPKTAQEAVEMMGSARFARLDEDRRAQYADEAARLIRELPQEERRAMMTDEESREALRTLREQMFDDLVRRYARGEELPRFGPPPGERRERGEGERGRWQEMSEEDRAAAMERMRSMINERLDSQMSSGNAQTGALRGEMFKRRGGGGPGGGRGGR